MSEKKYQILPDLTEQEYEELKTDIEARGVMVPVEYDEDGNILDGHHRVKICEELGIKWPKAIIYPLLRHYNDKPQRRQP